MDNNSEIFKKRINAALALREIPDYDAALEQLLKAYEISSEDATLNLLIGLTCQELSADEGALPYFQKAYELSPSSTEIQIALGIAYYQNLLFEKALPLLQAATKLEQVNSFAYLCLAETYDALGKPEKYIDTMKKVISLDPNDLSFRETLAFYYESSNQHSKAGEEWAELASIKKIPIYHTYAGKAFLLAGLPDNAVNHFQSNLNLEPNIASHWADLASAYNGLGQFERALQIVETGLENFEGDLHLLAEKADVYYNMDRLDESEQILDLLLEKSDSFSAWELDMLIAKKIIIGSTKVGKQQAIDQGIALRKGIKDAQRDSSYPFSVSLSAISDLLLSVNAYKNIISLFEDAEPDSISPSLGLKYVKALIGEKLFTRAHEIFKYLYYSLKLTPHKQNMFLNDATDLCLEFYNVWINNGLTDDAEKVMQIVTVATE